MVKEGCNGEGEWGQRLFSWMEGLTRLAALNLLWLLDCSLLVTAIPSTGALFSVVHKWQTRGNDQPLFRFFWYHFFRDAKRTYTVGLILAVVGFLLFSHALYLHGRDTPLFLTWKYALFTLILLYVMTVLYVFSVHAVLRCSPGRAILTALVVGMKRPLVTLAIVVFTCFMILFLLFVPGIGIFLFGSATATVIHRAVLAVIVPASASEGQA